MTKNKNGKIDQILLFIVFALLVFGLIMIASAGVAYSKTRFDSSYFFFKKQLLGVGVGLIALYFFQKINYVFWKKFSMIFFIGSVICLILVFVEGLGSKIYGASRWLNLGPISFQPSEMLKLSLIIYLAAWLESRGDKVKDFFEGFIPFVSIVAIIGFLLMKQPDMGTLGILVLVAISIFFVAGSRIEHIFLMFAGGGLTFLFLILTSPYRLQRLTIFRNPGENLQGAGYHINQALIAIGTGGFFGLGLGHSLQKFNYLPEPVGDSIFAIVAEELGFLGAGVLIGLFVLFAFRGYKIAKNAPDVFSRLLAVGIVSWIVFQSAINIAAISGIVPLTGVPLPFISYGGTSMVFILSAVGILLNISRYSNSKQ